MAFLGDLDRGDLRVAGTLRRPFLPLGQAEVEHFDLPRLGNQNVLRFQVAMGDPFMVGRRQSIGQGNGQIEEIPERQSVGRNGIGQRFAPDQLHGQKVDLAGLLNRVDGDDVRVVEGGDRLGLALEPLAAGRISRQGFRQDLKGDLAAQAGVLRLEHFAHAAASQLGKDLVMIQALADQPFRLHSNEITRNSMVGIPRL